MSFSLVHLSFLFLIWFHLTVGFVRALFKHLIQLPNCSKEQISLMLCCMIDGVIVLVLLNLILCI